MPLPYSGTGGIPCYRTVPIEKYSDSVQTLFYGLVQRCELRRIDKPDEPLQGSYSAVANHAARKRAAKLVMYESNRGTWVEGRQPNPPWADGLYVWIRANDEPGEFLATAMNDRDFLARHQLVLSRLEKDGENYRVVSVDPNPLEHFAYFRFDPSRDNPDRVVDLIEACSRLGSTEVIAGESARDRGLDESAPERQRADGTGVGEATAVVEENPPRGWRERISINPRICHGKPCIKGTRVMVSVILDNLAEGESYESIMEGYRVAREDIQASLAFAAELAEDRYIPLEQGVAG